MSRGFSGIHPILATPFHEDGSIDYESQDRLIEHLLEHGAHGLGLFGNASEGYTLLPEPMCWCAIRWTCSRARR